MVLSALYAMAMMAVIVGIIVSIADEGWYTPTAIFFYVLIASFLLAGFLHIHELGDLLFGLIYFVCIPAGYLFLIVYAICNLNDVSWGTRETQKAVLENPDRQKQHSKKKQTEEEFSQAAQDVLDTITKQVKTEKIGGGSCSDAILSIFRWANNLVILNSLATMQKIFQNDPNEEDANTAEPTIDLGKSRKSIYHKKTLKYQNKTSGSFDDTTWAKTESNDKIKQIPRKEALFWEELIRNYLYPLDHDEKHQQEVAAMLKEFRNRVAFGFFFVNGLWVIIMTAMNQVKSTVSITVYRSGDDIISIEPLGFVFLIIFAVLLLLQMFGMIVHRYGTLLHVLSATELRKGEDPEKTLKKIKDMASNGDDQEYEEFAEVDDNGTITDKANDKEELDEIYENFEELKRSYNRKNKPKQKLDLDRNYRKTVKNMKRRQTQKNRVDWKGRRGINNDAHDNTNV